jgi:hypothetical protein
MNRRAFRFSFVPLVFVLVLAGPAAVWALDGPEELPTDGQNALKSEYDKWAGVWTKLLNGDVADPANTQHQQAIDAAAKWAAYRLTWGFEKDPGKTNDIIREFNDTLQTIRGGKDKSQKTGEMFIKQVIAHASEVMQTRKAIARINAARLLARISDQGPNETPADILSRLTGTNESDLADALTAAINNPGQIDAVRYWAFRGLRYLLALPPQDPPRLPRAKEEAALEAVVKFLQDRNKDFPAGTPQDEIDGYRLVRRQAVEALAQGRYPTLADKSRPAWMLLKVVARDGIAPEPRLDERVEAAIGIARAQPELDKDYQPDYAAHQLGLFVADYAAHYAQSKQGALEDTAVPWKVDASRLIEALEQMKAQTKNPHVARVADESAKLLTNIEKALGANPFDLEQSLQAEGSPSQQLYKGDAAAVVKPANRKDAAPEKAEEKKEKAEEKKDK